MGRPDRDREFTDFARGAEGSLMATAWLLTGSTGAAAALVQEALAITYVAWPRVRGGPVLEHTRRVLASLHLDTLHPTEGSDEIHRWLAGLPGDQRRVVVLHAHAALSEQETADALGTSVEAVASLWSEAVTSLREVVVADRADLGGFTRPTATTPPPDRSTRPGPDTSTSGEHETPGSVRGRLEAALPTHWLPLDLDDARRRGARSIRRRRGGQVLVAAVVVGALGAGAAVLVRARTTTTPVASASSAPTTRSPVASGPATLHAGGFGGDDPTYLVRLRPGTNGSSTVDVTDVTDASHGSRGPVVSLAPVPNQAGRRITWARVGATSTVVGVIPSGTAQSDVEPRTDRNYGAWSVDVQPIPGSDWSAFVLTFQQPLRGRSPVTDVLWWDHAGRPVGKDGRVGASASVDGRTVWITADGKEIGALDGGRTTAHGTLPYLLIGEGGATSTTSRLTIFGPPQAVAATAALSDGRKLRLHPVALDARYSVAAVSFVTTGTSYPTLTGYSWTDAQGSSHEVRP